MHTNDRVLGGRLPLLDPKQLEGDQETLYKLLNSTFITWAEASGFKGRTDDGKLIGPFNPNLYSPGITPSWIHLVQAESRTTSLSKRAHEIVIIAVASVWEAPYALYAHAAIARDAGVPENAIKELAAGGSANHLSPEEQVAYRFARQLAAERKVSDGLYREAEAIFGQAGLVDMVYLIGIYLLTCALLNAFEIPAPE